MSSFYPRLAQEAPVTVTPPVYDISQIPQVTIQNIGADPGWFTQPVATVLAGIFAGILAAGSAFLAYRGVMKQIGSTDARETSDRQLNALVDGLVTFQSAQRTALEFIAGQGGQKFLLLYPEITACRAAEAKLTLLELSDAAAALNTAIGGMLDLTNEEFVEGRSDEVLIAKLTKNEYVVHDTFMNSALAKPHVNLRRKAIAKKASDQAGGRSN